MKRANIQAVRDKLSALLNDLRPGDKLLICKHNRPIAELRKLANGASGRVKRVLPVEPPFRIPDAALFDPLPDEVLRSFSGEDDPA